MYDENRAAINDCCNIRAYYPLMEGKAGEGVAYKKYHRLSAAEMMYVIFQVYT